MIARRLLGFLLAAAPLSAELAFSVVESSGETAAQAQVQLPSTAAGDTLDTLFRVRNMGSSTAPLKLLSIAGSGFSLTNLPALPRHAAAGRLRRFYGTVPARRHRFI